LGICHAEYIVPVLIAKAEIEIATPSDCGRNGSQ